MPIAIAADSCRMFLLRHGATENNLAVPPRLQGCRSDPPLSAEGKLQATRAAACLQPLPIAAVYSSPLRRAQETAELIAAPHRIAPCSMPQLREVDVGDWEGRSWEEIERNELVAYREFIEAPDVRPYRGGESLAQVLARVEPVFESILAENLGRMVVVVGHNVVNRVELASLLGLPLARARSLHQDNCGINVIERHREATRLLTLNAAFHLGG